MSWMLNAANSVASLGLIGDVTISSPSVGHVLTWNGSAWVNQAPAASGLANIVEDTTPQLGGNLDGNGFDIDLDAGNNLTIGTAVLEVTDQTYGSLKISGGENGGYAGIAVQDDAAGHIMNMMTNGVTCGLYDDTGTLNDWIIRSTIGAEVELFHAGNGEIRTQGHAGLGNSSGGQVRDHGNNWRDIGFNVAPATVNSSVTLGAQHVGRVLGKAEASTARTITLPASTDGDVPTGAVFTIINGSTANNVTVTEGSGTTLFQLDGSTKVDTAGGCTVGPGGFATLYKYTSAVWYIFGSGITP